ncbi:MAG: helix-turn-helix domain-containing protein [Acidimicrobiales bacterium]|nr:helix-turn-helix domain-containing protein [Acidimicrobiales bacterium]HMS86873.1 helix-turn-helix domain-containing protein [Acidimicrobiales bacterium]
MASPVPSSLEARAARHAALGDPVRLGIVDELASSDRAPIELRRRFGLPSNLLAHHLDVLEGVGLIERSRSSGDGRRRYVHLRPGALDDLGPVRLVAPAPALFVCSANSARSQLAAALWRRLTGHPAASAGTHPSTQVHPGAIAAAERAGLDLSVAVPQALDDVDPAPALVVTVCDQAHEEVAPGDDWLHWSVPDPVPVGTSAAFDATVAELTDRIQAVIGAS